MFIEWRWRSQRYGGSHRDYVDEPNRHLLWFPKFDEMYGSEV
jgi:hypothetical protein